MSDEWDVDRLDLDAYLTRVGHTGPVTADERTLFALHRAHIAAIPFENLDIVLGSGIDVDLDSVQAKLVDRLRGGYCYEHGVLFAAVLERLGFAVRRLLARIGYDDANPRPRTHMLLHVWAGDESWLADVGFGGGLLEPLAWDDPGPVQQDGFAYQVFEEPAGVRRLRQWKAGEWSTLYSFTHEPQHFSDIVMSNHFTATHPSSPFAARPVAMRRETGVIRRLLGRELSLAHPDGSTTDRSLSDSDVEAALEHQFGLTLTRSELETVMAALPPHADDIDVTDEATGT